MKIFVLLLLAFALPSWSESLEDGWKGIQVFQSHRADVERAFVKPIEGDALEARYETKDALIHVLYAAGPCTALKTLTGRYNVPAGTVIEYDVVPKGDLRLKDLGWKRELYERRPDPHVVNMAQYDNRRTGIWLTTRTESDKIEIVSSIYFERTTELSSRFGCPPNED